MNFFSILDDSQTWLEVAYGTNGGGVRLIVRHPENIGHTPQLFQSYNVHANPVSKVLLGEKYLISGKVIANIICVNQSPLCYKRSTMSF